VVAHHWGLPESGLPDYSESVSS